jgi:hypothetical protein
MASPCCAVDEGGPLGEGLQDHSPNRRVLLRSQGCGGERPGKGRRRPVRWRPGKLNESEPSDEASKSSMVSERVSRTARGSAYRIPAYGVRGTRRQGGKILGEATTRNGGT